MGTYTGQAQTQHVTLHGYSGKCPRLFNIFLEPRADTGLCYLSLGCRIRMLCQLRDTVYGTAPVP